MTIRKIEELLLANGRKTQGKGTQLARCSGERCILGVSNHGNKSNSEWAMEQFGINKWDALQLMNGWDGMTTCSLVGVWPDQKSAFYKLGKRLAAKLLK